MTVDDMRKDGWPLKIIGNGGYPATLVGCQSLFDGDYMGIYRYPGGDCCHDPVSYTHLTLPTNSLV